MAEDLARIRADVARKRPPEVVRSAPLPARRRAPLAHVTYADGSRLVSRPVSAAPASRWQRFTAWRSEHYVADQAMRVIGIAIAALTAVVALISALVMVAKWAFGEISGALAAINGGVALVIVVVLLVVIAALRGDRSSSGGGHSGHGWHYGKCK